MERFLSQCAEFIYKKHSEELKDICLVFPNRRSGVFFTAYLQKILKSPAIGPKTTTVNELISGYSDWHPADKLQLISLLYDVFRKHTGTLETFDEFYFWGEILLADFNDIDRYLVDAKDLFTNISDLKEIESIFDYLTSDQKKAVEQFWGSMAVADKTGFREKYLRIWEKLFPVYTNFREELKKRLIAYPGMSDRDVAEKSDTGDLSFPFKKYYIMGLNALNACESKIFDHLQKAGKAVFLWDYDRHYLNDERNEAGYFLRQNLKRFTPPDDFELNTELFNHRKSIQLVAVSSVYGQSQQIPRFLDELKDKQEAEFDSTAVVLADETLLFSALGAIPEDFGTVNITMGYPVRNSVVFGFLLLMVNLLKNRRTDERGAVAYHRYVTDILNHQLLADVETEKVREFVAELRKHNKITVSLTEIEFSPIHSEIFQLPQKTEDYSAYFLRVLSLFYERLKHSEPSDPMLTELIYSIYQSIEKLGATIKSASRERPVSDAVYFRLFSQYIGQVSVAFEGEPLSGLQVMGILETRCLDFKNLIILGLNENKWPRRFTAPSFIPHNIRKGFGLPGIDEQDAMYAYYFYRLIQRAHKVVATYSIVKEGINTGELSRYGFQLQYDSIHKPEIRSLDFSFSNDPVEEIRVESSERIVQQMLSRNSEHALSPSAVNTYLNCGLKFYFHYIADLPEPKEMKEEIDGMVFGNIFHDTMEELYKPYIGKIILPQNIDNILNDKVNVDHTITKFIGKHYLKQNAGKIKLEGKTLLFFENIRTYLGQLLKIDKLRAPFKVVGLEREYKREIEIGGKKIWIGGKIDRIDQKDGITRIIDYKTGKVDSLAFKNVEQLFVRDDKNPKKEILQAMIYCWGISQEYADSNIQPAIYVLQKLFEKEFDPAVRCNQVTVDFEQISTEFEAELKGLVSEIFSPETTFKQTEHRDKCSYCVYKGICRRW